MIEYPIAEIKNKPEFIALIKKYRSFSVEDFEGLFYSYGYYVMKELTGFGSCFTCSLCNPMLRDTVFCDHCMYVVITGHICYIGDNLETYNAIKYATNVKDLHEAVNARADYMESLLNE